MQAPKNVYPSFHPCLAAHRVDRFGDIIPTGAKVIRLNTLNLAQNFELCVSPHYFLGDTQIFKLTFEAPPVARHLAKFHGDRSRELGDLGPKWGKGSFPHFFGSTVPGGLIIISLCMWRIACDTAYSLTASCPASVTNSV